MIRIVSAAGALTGLSAYFTRICTGTRPGYVAVDIDDLSPAQSAMLAEREDSQLEDMRLAIFRLEDDYREPLVLQVLMGHSTREIAELMGIQQGAVLTRLHRARHKLKDEMDKEAAA